MKRSEMGVENYEAVYDHFLHRDPNPRTARFLHRLFGTVYSPYVRYAEGAQDQLEEHFDQDKPIIFAANHVSIHDHFNLASIVQNETTLRPMRENVGIVAKVPLFTLPVLGVVITPAISSFGAIPAYRSQDIEELASHLETEQEREDLRSRCAARLVETCVDKLDKNINVAIYPQGTRIDTYGQLGKLKRGIGSIACGAARPEDLLILPVGIDYNADKATLKRKPWKYLNPAIYIGNPFPVAENEYAVVEETRAALQSALDNALALSGKGKSPS